MQGTHVEQTQSQEPHPEKLFTCKKCKKSAGMCLKPGQPGHLPCAKTRKVHVTQKESITIERYVKAINKYKRKWKRNNRGKVWTGEVPGVTACR